MRSILVVAMAMGCAVTCAAQYGAGNAGNYGRIMFPGGEVPGGPNRSGGYYPGGPTTTGRVLFPGTGAPAFVNQNYPLFLGNNLPTIDHQPHDRSRPGPGRTQRVVPVAYPVYYGGAYYPYEPPPAEQASPINYNSQNVFTGSGNGQQDQGPASPVVIINQYFQTDPTGASNSNTVTRQQIQTQPAAPASNEAPSVQAPDQQARLVQDDISRLFLIALNDSSVVTASAYWVEDDTLNYITTSGSHNRVSMQLVNRSLSERLNSERRVTFGLPAQRPSALDAEP